MMFDTNKKPLEFGAIYCCVLEGEDEDGNLINLHNEIIVYASDEEFYSLDNIQPGELPKIINPAFDHLVRQDSTLLTDFI